MNNANGEGSNENSHNDDFTSAALLEQLVYVDTFMPEIDDPTHLDDRLTAELAAFVGDSFVFPDEDKPKLPKQEEDDQISDIKPVNGFNSTDGFSSNNNTSFGASDIFLNNNMNPLNYNTNPSVGMNQISLQQQQQQQLLQQQLQQPLPSTAAPTDILSILPKVPVPPGAKSSLIAAGLSTTQIDALAALIAQHETSKNQAIPTTFPSSSATALTNTSSSLLKPFSTLSSASTTASSNAMYSASTSSAIVAALGNNDDSRSSSRSRNNSSVGLPKLDEEESTGDPELDKRKRNTAASARFRIKKKLKEQQLERSVRELTELTMTLEKKIQTLEMENRLLRNLVVEKGEQRNNSELEMLKQRAKMASDDSHLNR